MQPRSIVFGSGGGQTHSKNLDNQKQKATFQNLQNPNQ